MYLEYGVPGCLVGRKFLNANGNQLNEGGLFDAIANSMPAGSPLGVDQNGVWNDAMVQQSGNSSGLNPKFGEPAYRRAVQLAVYISLRRSARIADRDLGAMYKVIYLTGAPASGKTTTVDLLAKSGKAIETWSYGDRLRAYLNERHQPPTHAEMRGQSSMLISPEDIVAVDQKLQSFVEEHRGRKNIIIDSHAVTKERYGFRVTAFSLDQLKALAPDEIWMTFTGAAETVSRIVADSQGRPLVTEESAAMHTNIQAAVATTYGILAGRPVYFFDSSVDAKIRAEMMIARLG